MVTEVTKANDETKMKTEATTTTMTMTTTLPQPPNADDTKGISEGGGGNDDDENVTIEDLKKEQQQQQQQQQQQHQASDEKSKPKKTMTMTNSKKPSSASLAPVRTGGSETNKTKGTAPPPPPPPTLRPPMLRPPPPTTHPLLLHRHNLPNPAFASGITATQNMVALATSAAFRHPHPHPPSAMRPPPPPGMRMMASTTINGKLPPPPQPMKMIRLPLPDRMAMLKKPPYAPRRGTATSNNNNPHHHNTAKERPPRKKRKKSAVGSEAPAPTSSSSSPSSLPEPSTTATTTAAAAATTTKKQIPSFTPPSSSLLAASLSALFRNMDDSEFVRSIAVEFKRRGYSVAIQLRPLEEQPPPSKDNAPGGGDDDDGAIQSKVDDDGIIEGSKTKKKPSNNNNNNSTKTTLLPLPNFPFYPSTTSISAKKAEAWNRSYSLLRTYHAENCGALPSSTTTTTTTTPTTTTTTAAVENDQDRDHPHDQKQKYPALEKWAKTQLALWKRMKRDGKHNLSLERISKLHSLNLETMERGAQQQQQLSSSSSSPADTAELGSGESGSGELGSGELSSGGGGKKERDGGKKSNKHSNNNNNNSQSSKQSNNMQNILRNKEEGDEMTNLLLMSSSLNEGKNTEKWQEKFERLKRYKEEHGHTNVPRSVDNTLSKWCNTQRKRCKELLKGDAKTPMTRTQFRALESIGFDIHWDRKQNRELIDRKWEEKFANINKHGGAYINGHSHSFVKKLEVGAKYNNALRNGNGIRPNISELQRECRVSRGFVKKVEEELIRVGRILKPSEIQQNKAGLVGPGSRSFDEIDSAILLFLYLEEPSRSFRSYVDWLEIFTGTTTSKSTVHSFLRAFPHQGGFCRPNLVPFDKFRPKNIERAFEFLDIISKIDPARIKFGDEKHLKGDAIFNRKVRRNPITGEVPEMIVTPDFRNRYNLTGFCSINPMTTKYAVWCSLHECINDADQFHLELENAIHSGFFCGGDVLVLDNAAVHTGKENSVLQDYLWEKYTIFLLFLPARAPEWNPMEQVWKSLVQRLRELPVNKCREVAKETGPHPAIEILSGITYDEVKQFYRGSGLVPQD